MRDKLRELDQLMGRAVRLLYKVNVNAHDPVMGPEEWEGDRLALINEYRDLVLSLDDTPSPASGAGVPTPDDPRYSEARRTGGVAVRWILGEVLRANPVAHALYHSDPSTKYGIEVTTGVLGAVAAVLVDEGDSSEFAAHIVHVVAHRLSGDTPPSAVDIAALGTANTALDLTDPQRTGTQP